VLVIEDDARIRRGLQMTLQRDGLEVTAAATGKDGLERLRERSFDVVLLDLMLPGRSGFEVCRVIRRTWHTPVLVVTARGGQDVVAGLQAGADDYVTRPFVATELLARIRALARHTHASPERRSLTVGDLVISPEDGTVTRGGQTVELTRTEVRLLTALALERGRVFSREELLARVWGSGHVGDARLVDVHVRRLRKKIEADPGRPTVVTTVRGMGYRIPE
jgi:DNA-binding response OmpR family regulator